jgi:ATP-binding protein involved in chromosome partitioning
MAGAVIVSTPQSVAISDARRGLKMFQQLQVRCSALLKT